MSEARVEEIDRLPQTPARSVFLALVQAHEALSSPFKGLFRAQGLTGPQFNVLRILLQSPPEGVHCRTIGEQLIHRVPDVSRLVDRMERDGLVERAPDPADRRAVFVRITDAGRERCRSLYDPLAQLHEELLAHLEPAEQSELDRLLRKAFAPHRS